MNIGRIISHDDCPETIWKNGGGTTREIIAYPPDASFDEFQWRLSAARIDSPGDFSHFADVDRTIAVLYGALSLAVADTKPQRLDPTSAPFRFAGDAPARGKPLGGPVLDLNLMVRRGQAEAEMRRISEGRVPARDGKAILFALQDSQIGVGSRNISLMANDSFEFDASAGETISIDRPALLILIEPELQAA